MGSFSKSYLKSLTFHTSTTWYLTLCSEASGMQKLWNSVKPEVLKKLKESAIIQSTESSNRIEGVVVEKGRLLPLALGKSKPRDRSEEEIVGYRNALSFIHKNYKSLKINATTIKKIHALAQGGMISDAGLFKTKDNDIIEINQVGDRSIRFTPTTAKDTAKAIDQLCLGYQDLSQNNKVPTLILIANFVFDFLCIHPFRDGNGRVSRLLTLLLMEQQGFEVGRYISLERIVENTKEDYYRVLKESSENWHQDQHELMPWWNYLLGVVKSAYQELKERVNLSTHGDHKSSLLRQTILTYDHPFQISEIQNLHPSIDRELIKKVLSRMKKEGLIISSGTGRAATWQKRNE